MGAATPSPETTTPPPTFGLAPSAPFPIRPLSAGLQRWSVPNASFAAESLGAALGTLAVHHRVVLVALADVLVPPVAGGPVYRLSTLLPSALRQTVRALAATPGHPVCVCIVAAGLESRVASFEASLPLGVGGIVWGVMAQAAGMAEFCVRPTGSGWAWNGEGQVHESPFQEGIFRFARPPSSRPTVPRALVRPVFALTLAPAPEWINGCTPPLRDGMLIWTTGAASGVSRLIPPILAELARRHRVLWAAPASMPAPPVAGGPVFGMKKVLPGEVGNAVRALVASPGRPVVVVLAGESVERRLAEYADSLPEGVGVVAVLAAPSALPFPHVHCDIQGERWSIVGPRGRRVVVASAAGLAALDQRRL